MESLGRYPRVLYVFSREKIKGPPRDFLKANMRPDLMPKTQGAAVALRVFGLWSG